MMKGKCMAMRVILIALTSVLWISSLAAQAPQDGLGSVEVASTQPVNPVLRGKTGPELVVSFNDAKRVLPPQKRAAFDQAAEAIMAVTMVKMFDGKSVDEIIAQAKTLQNEPAAQIPVRDRTRGELLSTLTALQTVAAQRELYKLQHGDRYPDYAAHGWEQLLKKTEEGGQVSATGRFGPYLAKEPVNALRKASGVVPGELDAVVTDAKAGWLQAPDGRLHALDAEGRVLKQ